MKIFTKNELELFEDLFNLNNGHILNMSRGEFEKFIYRSIGIDITSESYEKKVKKQQEYYSMKQIYRFIVKCEDGDKSIKFLNDLIDYIDNNKLDNIDNSLLIMAKDILKNKSNLNQDFSDYGSAEKSVDDFFGNIEQTIDNEMPAFSLEYNNENETIKRPFQAYMGDESYCFISYAHKDAKIVFSEIKKLYDEGYNIWYDEGLTPGKEWDEEIEEKLCNSSLVIVFISKNSMGSINVRNEIKLALNEDINVVLIYLEETELAPGLKLRLGNTHRILKFSLSDEDYLNECFKAFENANLHRNKQKDRILLKKYNSNLKKDTDVQDEVILPGCNKKESLIFKDLCDYCLDKSFDVEIDPVAILSMAHKYYDENSENLADKIRYSLKNLEKNNYITSKGSSLGMGIPTSSITFHGFCFYLKNILKDESICSNVIHGILVDGLSTIDEISRKYDVFSSIVEEIIKLFRKNGCIICNADLTDIAVIPGAEDYFEKILHNS